MANMLVPVPVLPVWPLISAASDGLSASFNDAGYVTDIGPLANASGSAPPAFDSKTTISALHRSIDLDPHSPARPTVTIDARTMVDEAKSAGFGVDDISASATSSIASLNLLLTDNPLSALSVLGLSVSATFIKTGADASYVVGPNSGFLSGDASFGSLTIGGALIGGTVSFRGSAPANLVLFDSPTVKITLDKQDISGFYPPAPAAVTAGPGNRITTDALDIQLNNARLFGQNISGNIDIGQAFATLWPIVPVPTPVAAA
jgi:hypothetical protein